MKKINTNIFYLTILLICGIVLSTSCKKASPLIPLTKDGVSNQDRYKKEEPRQMTPEEKAKQKEIEKEYKQGTKK